MASAEIPAAAPAAAPIAAPSTERRYPGIRYCDAGRGIRLAYEVFGTTSSTSNTSSPPIVLVMGLGSQMLSWPRELCVALARQTGRRVVRFDNRDVGLSTHLSQEKKKVNVLQALMTRDFSAAPYKLADMADDVAALIRHLATEAGSSTSPRAHVIGASMGGMIAQELALRHPELVVSLTSVMSTPDVRVGGATDEAKSVLVAPPPRGRDEAIQRAVDVYTIIGSRKYPAPEAALRAMAAEAFDRSFDPAGGARQLLAIWASPARTERMRAGGVRCPVLVLHGVADPLITVEGGRATAAAIGQPPQVELVELEHMGHDFPLQLWPDIIEPIARLVRRAERQEQGAAALPAAKL